MDNNKEQPMEWISVNDRFPETYTRVLIYGRYTRDCPMQVFEAMFHQKGRRFTSGGIISKGVTHWMLLPKAPQL